MTSAAVMPDGEIWAPTQLNHGMYRMKKYPEGLSKIIMKIRYSLCQDNGHCIIKDTLAKQQRVEIQIHT